jgi:hypothetical protein
MLQLVCISAGEVSVATLGIDVYFYVYSAAVRYLRGSARNDATVAESLLATGVWRDLIQLAAIAPLTVSV